MSPISAWEIDLKATRGALELPLPAEEWFNEVVAAHGLTLSPLGVDVLTLANRLPWHHKDPADRFIIATAVKEDAAVVTADRRFSKYKVRVLA